jgi:hypothetical protein
MARLAGGARVTEAWLLIKGLRWFQLNPSAGRPAKAPELPADLVMEGDLLHDVIALLERSPQLELRRWQALLWRDEGLRDKIRPRVSKQAARRLDRLARAYPGRRAGVSNANDRSGIADAAPERTGRVAESRATLAANAGLVVLWPLLPDLFRHLKLWDNQHFATAQAQEQAAAWLDWLIWRDDSTTDERIGFARHLCNLPLARTSDPCTTSCKKTRELLDNWLATLPQILPGWRSLQPEDIRALFLRRSGVLSTVGEVSLLNVDPQPFDILLRDWPWPLTTVVLPWLSSPIEVDWPIPDHPSWMPS